MKIKITKEDIKNGKPCDSENCAVSQALMRHFNTDCLHTSLEYKNIVDDDETIVVIGVDNQRYFVSEKDRKKVVKFINEFDDLYSADDIIPPKPISFELNQKEI